MDLRELFADESTLTPRYVLWLVEWLPDTSALHASAQGGPKHRGWNADRHAAISTVELLAAANWQRGGGKGQRPKPIPRPEPKSKRRRVVTVAELNQGGQHGGSGRS